jgi:CRISPR system Cascade subunit CasA
MQFNILTQPWIPVLTLSGVRKELGLLDTLEQAQNLRELDIPNAMDEYSLYRFLILFLMAVYRPRNADDLLYILDANCIDRNRLQKYLKICQDEGVSFDIFDEKRPFLQSPFDPRWDTDKNLKSVAELDYTRASGNNPVHFDHTYEKDACMTPAQAARGLLTVQLFCTAGTHRPSNVYRKPPLFFLIKGKTLLETLVFSMVPIPLGQDSPLELWRCTDPVEPEKKVVSTSLLYGMLFPSRRVRLVGNNGQVRNVYFQAGLDYVAYDAWTDPHVAYVWRKGKKGEKERHAIDPSDDKEPWRNIGTITENFAEQAPTIFNQYQKNFKDELDRIQMDVMIFGVVTEQYSHLSIQRGELQLDTRITESPEKCHLISEAVKYAENVADYLRKTLNQLCAKQQQFRKNEIQSVLRSYYSECGKLFDKQLCFQVATADTDDDKQNVASNWGQAVQKVAWSAYDAFCKEVCSNAEWLLRAEKERKLLYNKLATATKRYKKGR